MRTLFALGIFLSGPRGRKIPPAVPEVGKFTQEKTRKSCCKMVFPDVLREDSEMCLSDKILTEKKIQSSISYTSNTNSTEYSGEGAVKCVPRRKMESL